MADAKITALTENTTPLPTDLSVMVDDPAGTPLTQKVTLRNQLIGAGGLDYGKDIASYLGFNRL